MLRRWMPLWVIPILLLMALGSVWLRLAIIDTTYQIHQSDRTIRELQQNREQMELRYTGLRSPRRLELLARTRFSLTQPRSDQIVHMGSAPNAR